MKNNTKNTDVDSSSEKPEASNIFDKSVLLELASDVGSTTLIPKLSEIFFRTLPETLEKIENARANRDTDALRICFHNLKSNAATLGLPDLEEMCAGLELTYRTADNPTLSQDTLDSLKTTSQQASQALKEFLQSL